MVQRVVLERGDVIGIDPHLVLDLDQAVPAVVGVLDDRARSVVHAGGVAVEVVLDGDVIGRVVVSVTALEFVGIGPLGAVLGFIRLVAVGAIGIVLELLEAGECVKREALRAGNEKRTCPAL